MKRCISIWLFVISIFPLYAQYSGGNNDGFSSGLLSQTSCPPLADFIYYGGINDGYATGLLSQTNCTPYPADFIYYGGINDGYATGLLSQTNCTPYPADFIYYGGINDGFSGKLLNQIANCLPVLPIELLTFTANCEGNAILLKWSTATETNNDFFSLEKSIDAINYELLGKVNGAGNSLQTLNYSFVDPNPIEGTGYYRLKQTDFGGKYKYSKIIAVNCVKIKSENIIVYPNPASYSITIELLGNNKTLPLEIINARGQIIYSGTITNKINLPTNELISGIYFIKITTEYDVLTNKIIIEK